MPWPSWAGNCSERWRLWKRSTSASSGFASQPPTIETRFEIHGTETAYFWHGVDCWLREWLARVLKDRVMFRLPCLRLPRHRIAMLARSRGRYERSGHVLQLSLSLFLDVQHWQSQVQICWDAAGMWDGRSLKGEAWYMICSFPKWSARCQWRSFGEDKRFTLTLLVSAWEPRRSTRLGRAPGDHRVIDISEQAFL